MMKIINRVLLAALLIAAFIGNSLKAEAQPRRPYNGVNHDQVEQLLDRINDEAKNFRSSLDRALDDSRLDGSRREDNINELVKDLEKQTKRLEDRFDRNEPIRDELQQLRTSTQRLDDIMRRARLGRETQRAWTILQADLDRLQNLVDAARR